MTFEDYLTCDKEELFESNVRNIRFAIEHDVKHYGFNPEKVMKSVENTDTAEMFAVFQTWYEATRERWIDARNRQSNDVLRALFVCPSFQTRWAAVLGRLSKDDVKFCESLAKEIGVHMHRTNLQTYTQFIVYVLGKMDPAIGSYLAMGRGRENYWSFAMI